MTIAVKKIADSVSPNGIRLPTLQLRYPKFTHGEFLTHRVFSRNSSSSRAIPVERLVQDIIDDPVIPSFWGKNQKGMQAIVDCNNEISLSGYNHTREEVWNHARRCAIYYARSFAEAGYHKQIVNRLLEPFCHINTVVTATDWDNFFALRCHKDAQPEMRLLAETIRNVMEESKPIELKLGQWHLPYVT
jgi:thymidylate synthase ThyX